MTKNTLQQYYKDAYRPFIVTTLKGHILLGVLLGLFFGTLAYGLVGTIINLILFTVVLVIRSTGLDLLRSNGSHIRVFLYSNVIITILGIYMINVGMAIINMAVLNSFKLIGMENVFRILLSFSFIAITYIITYILIKSKISIGKNQIEIIRKNKLIGMLGIIGTGGAASFGLILSRIFIDNASIMVLIFIFDLILVTAIIAYGNIFAAIYKKMKSNEI